MGAVTPHSAALYGRGVHSSTSQLNLRRFGHTSLVPLSDRLGENHAPNICAYVEPKRGRV